MYMYYLLGHRLMELPVNVERKSVISKNTFLLALDGDIDFKPEAVLLLLDLMKRDENLGAACGRIHPIGQGKIESDRSLMAPLCAGKLHRAWSTRKIGIMLTMNVRSACACSSTY
jgi:hypothetical protein